jgi:intracellular septation protein A
MDQISPSMPAGKTPANVVPARTISPGLKFALEMGPLLLFFFANFRPKWFEPLMRPFLPAKLLEGKEAGLFTATGVLMAAVILALIVSFAKTRRLPLMPLVTAVLVEIVWRNFSEHTWVLFKFPGTVVLIFLFTFSQVPLIMKHELKGDAAEQAPEHL